MANIKSAAKRAKQALVRRDKNQQAKKAIRTLERTVRVAIAGKDKEAPTLLKNFTSQLGKATQKGMYHKNTAARKVSRLTQSLNKAANS